MSLSLSNQVSIAWLCFCRIGGCMMLVPGLASPRIPMRIRLLIAMMTSLACMPLAVPFVAPIVKNADQSRMFILLATELLFGFLLGMLCRIFFSALQFAMTAIGTLIGLSSPSSQSFESDDVSNALTEIVTATTVVLFFELNQHMEIIAILAGSYSTHPVVGNFDINASLEALLSVLSVATALAARLSSPFIIYSIFINFTLGLSNKIIPQMPVQFIGAPVLLGGGLILLYLLSTSLVSVYSNEFDSWLSNQ